jgi:hypothetical protein
MVVKMNNRKRRTIRLVLSILLLAAAASILAAQQPAQVMLPRKPFIFMSGDLPRKQLYLMGALLQSNVQAKTEAEPAALAVSEVAPTREAMIEQARQAGADCIISVRAASQEDRAMLSSSFIEFDRPEPVWEGAAIAILTAKELEESAWSGLVEKARSLLVPAPQKVILKEVVVEKGVIQEVKRSVGIPVTIRAVPGSTLYGVDHEMVAMNVGSTNQPMIQKVEVIVPIEIPASGFVTREVAPQSSFLLRAEKLGLFPGEYNLGVGIKPKDVAIPQRVPNKLEIEFYTNFYPDSALSLNYYLIPGSFYLGFGFNQTFAIAAQPRAFATVDSQSWWTNSLAPFLEFGWMMLPADSYMQFCLGFSSYLNFIKPWDSGLRIHPLYPLYTSPNLKLEWRPFRGFSLYIRWSPRFIAGWSENPGLYSNPGDPFYYLHPLTNDSNRPYNHGSSGFTGVIRAPGSNYAIDLNFIPYLGLRFELPY